MRASLAAVFGLSTFIGVLVAGCGGSVNSTSPARPSKITPAVTVTPAAPTITTAQPLAVTVTVSGSGGSPTGAVTLTSGSYSSGPAALTNGSAVINISAGTLPAGSNTLTATYSPDAAGAGVFNGASGTAIVTVTAPALITPSITLSPSSSSITTAQSVTVTIGVSGGSGNPTPTGSVNLTSGSYSSAVTALSSGSASIVISAGSLSAGNNTLNATYTPDAASSAIYAPASGNSSIAVSAVSVTFSLAINSSGPSSGITVRAGPADKHGTSTGNTPFTLTYDSETQVTLSAALSDNGYSFVSWSGCTSNPSATTCAVNMSANTTVTAAYNGNSITSVTVSPGSATIGTQQQFTATVTGSGAFSKSVSWSLSPSTAGTLVSNGNSTALYNTPYPAPATVTITATSTQDTTKSGTVVVQLNPTAPAAGPALNIDVNTPNDPAENPHTISPYVYGVNGYGLDLPSARTINPGIIRWGGDDISRYNFLNNMTNSASDWYFENFQGAGNMFPNGNGGGTNFTAFIQSNQSVGAATLGTVPVLGWVANSMSNACSFPKSQFPNQKQFNAENCGNGVALDSSNLLGNNTIATVTSIAASTPDITSPSTPGPGSVPPAWVKTTWAGAWVNSLATNASFGSGASGKGVAVWYLDNEPTWWNYVHRDVHPNPFTYDEVTNNGIGTALAIKTADPTALVSGPVIDWWWAYFYSKKDVESGWASSNGACPGREWNNPVDRAAHNGVPMIEYYLQQFQKYSQSYGFRLLDYLGVHAYFAPAYNGSSVAFTTAGDTQEQKVRMNGTRVFWDSTYTDPGLSDPNYTGAPSTGSNCSPGPMPPQVIPRLRIWVKNDYPGTRTAIDEYNFGALESINGAVVQADILGIFGREGLDLGALWTTNTFSQSGPGNFAFAMYRNYDGKDSTFGDAYLQATSTANGADAQGQLAVYAAQRSSDHAITIIVINKTYESLTSTLSLQNFVVPAGTTAQVYRYSNANLSAIALLSAAAITQPSGAGTTSTISYTFPAQSITLFVVPD